MLPTESWALALHCHRERTALVGSTAPHRILTINTGSSSLKVALYRMDGSEDAVLDIRVERIGSPSSSMVIVEGEGRPLLSESRYISGHPAALDTVLSWLDEHGYGDGLDAVGHRVVHGGKEYTEPQLVTTSLIAALRELVPVDPNHLPQAIEALEAARHAFPATPQVACFDTSFHRHMPRVAQMYALPRRFGESGVIRYGFHGLSYEYVLRELRSLDRTAANGRLVIAHLGNGASMAAVREGTGIDTTMGYTPTGGLVMGTRTGDLDPGVLLYLLQSQGMSPAEVNTLVNHQAGLLGVSENSADMQSLLQAEATDARAAEAVELFCYEAKKFIGGLAAALAGLDTLVFTGGIGEHAAPVRQRICSGLEFLGVRLDPEANARNAPIISRNAGTVTVRVMATNEDRMIAEHTRAVLEERGGAHVHI